MELAATDQQQQPTPRCPRCGGELPLGTLMGICPKCVGRVVFHLCDEETVPDQRPLGNGTEFPGPGTRVRYVGDYELLEVIGRGGMGVVYRARQLSLDRQVAVKMILAGQLATEREIDRFRQEAEAAAKLDHPNIVTIHEVGEHQGLPYFSMQLVEGNSLASAGPTTAGARAGRQARPHLTDHKSVAHLMRKVAQAVHHAHQRGILHRDVKPGNILLDAHGEPHVTDFGLAKQVDSQAGLTLSDSILGTPHYMSPEQAAGRKDLTTATDIYSLGAVLYFLLTGRPPFEADTPLALLKKVAEEEVVSLRSRTSSGSTNGQRAIESTAQTPGSDIDPDLETICLKCLEKDPERRYRSAEALADDLGRWLRQEPILARPATQFERLRKWIRRRPAAAALVATSALLLLSLAIGGSVYSVRLRAARDILEANLYAAETANAFAAWERGSLTLPRKLLDRQIPQPGRPERRCFEWFYLDALCRPRVLFTFGGQLSPVFGLACSPDGRTVAAAHQNGKVRLLDLVDRREIGWLEGISGYSVVFSPDGKLLAGAGPDWPRVGAGPDWPVWDLERHTVVTNLVGDGYTSVGLAWSPDGRMIATTSATDLYAISPPGPITVWDARTFKRLLALEGHAANAWKPDFSPDSRRLATPHADGSIILWDLASRKPLKTFRRHGNIVSCVRFSPDGQWLASASMDETVRLWSVDGDEHIPLGSHARPVDCVAFSRDGRWLASGSRDHTAKLWDLANLSNKPLTLRGHTGRLWSIDFTPDSQTLVTGSLDGTVKLWDLGHLGNQQSQVDNNTPLGTVFSHDGRLNLRSEGTNVVIREVESERVIAALPAARAAFSPQGSIASVSDTTGFSVWDGPAFEGRRDVPSAAKLNGALQFSSDGRWLALAQEANSDHWAVSGASSIEIRETSQYRLHGTWRLDSAATNTFRDFCFSPDNRFLVASCRDGRVRVLEVGTMHPARTPHRAPLHALRLAWMPGTHTLCIGTLDGLVHLWDVAKDRTEIITPEAGVVLGLSVSPDGKTLAVGTQDGVLKLFNLQTRWEIAVLKGHLTAIFDVSFSPDGRLLVSTGADASRIWRAFTPGETRQRRVGDPRLSAAQQ